MADTENESFDKSGRRVGRSCPSCKGTGSVGDAREPPVPGEHGAHDAREVCEWCEGGREVDGRTYWAWVGHQERIVIAEMLMDLDGPLF